MLTGRPQHAKHPPANLDMFGVSRGYKHAQLHSKALDELRICFIAVSHNMRSCQSSFYSRTIGSYDALLFSSHILLSQHPSVTRKDFAPGTRPARRIRRRVMTGRVGGAEMLQLPGLDRPTGPHEEIPSSQPQGRKVVGLTGSVSADQ